jgi:hypothetical protein
MSNRYLDRAYLAELSRPWKLANLGLGMAWLLYGALNYGISDWDVGISLLMGGLTYVCAHWSAVTLLGAARHRMRDWFGPAAMALFVALIVVDGVYVCCGRSRIDQLGGGIPVDG